ncbi:MAG: TfoX/Sxy family protein [Clostridia bacterium]|nr:TfoX/Sxy family protein [Clostridia bacterium]
MTKLTEMLNIGKEMECKLQSVGIESAEKLVEIGAKDAYLKLKEVYPNVCLVHLYALEGAITDTDFNNLSEDTKKDLKTFSDKIKNTF